MKGSGLPLLVEPSRAKPWNQSGREVGRGACHHPASSISPDVLALRSLNTLIVRFILLLRLHPPLYPPPPLPQCVYDIFGCETYWCVRSHALASLLGAPKPALVQEIENIVRWAPATDELPPATPWKEQAEEEEDVPLQLLDGGEDPHSSEFKQLDPGTGEKLQFDVAFHIRTGDA